MNKSDLINALTEAGFNKADSKKALDTVLNGIADALKQNDKVALIGFGTFSVTTRAAHQGVNPATGAAITIPEKKVVKFKAGAEMAL